MRQHDMPDVPRLFAKLPDFVKYLIQVAREAGINQGATIRRVNQKYIHRSNRNRE
jgi:hypothetical protein